MLDPLQFSISVPLPPHEAFALFTDRLASWWPLDRHSVAGARAASCIVEPFPGGRVYETDVEGNEHAWGEVRAYEPPRRLVMSWHPGHDRVTEVEVRFTPSEDGTFVELEHRGWEAYGERASEVRDQYRTGWPFVFADRFGEAARNRSLPHP